MLNPIPLRDLEPEFLKLEQRRDEWMEGQQHMSGIKSILVKTDSINNAQALSFHCPYCYGHKVVCIFENKGVPDDFYKGNGRWHVRGSCFEDLTLMQPSAFLTQCATQGLLASGMVL